MALSFPKGLKILWEKEKLLAMSNFSFSRSVFKRLVLQTRKNQGLFGKGLTASRLLFANALNLVQSKNFCGVVNSQPFTTQSRPYLPR